MNRFLIATGLLILVAGGAAFAQSGSSSTSNSSTNTVRSNEAPIGHRQPRIGDVPDEKNLGNPNDAMNKEDAALDRKIKSICRGC